MNILMIYPKLQYMTPWIPIGFLELSSYIRSKGHKVEILDSNFNNINEELIKNKIDKFDLIGIGGTTVQYNDGIRIATLIKKVDPNKKIVFGGVHFCAPSQVEDALDFGDFCVIGEGEKSLSDLLSGKDHREIKGIAYKENGKIIQNDPQTYIENLDDIPLPAYDLVDLNRYSDMLVDGGRAVSLLTGRGCPYNCSFCASPQMWNRKVRVHSLHYVIANMKFIIHTYGINNFRIMDDTFTLNRNRVFDFCDLIEQNGLSVRMNFLTSVKNSDIEMFKRMKSVGFSLVGFGIESGDEDVLSRVSKNTKIEQIKMAVNNARAAGLNIESLFMIGNIGETEQSIINTIRLARELKSTYSYFQFAVPYPGSKFYDEYKNHGYVTNENFDLWEPRKLTFVPNGLTPEKMNYYMGVAMP